jgi:hypothetical protein
VKVIGSRASKEAFEPDRRQFPSDEEPESFFLGTPHVRFARLLLLKTFGTELCIAMLLVEKTDAMRESVPHQNVVQLYSQVLRCHVQLVPPQ